MKPRRVIVDMGHAPHEYQQYATVVREAEHKGVFEDKPHKVLLVELLGGERVWVNDWEELP
jgi:hypothetical protein